MEALDLFRAASAVKGLFDESAAAERRFQAVRWLLSSGPSASHLKWLREVVATEQGLMAVTSGCTCSEGCRCGG